MYFSVRRCGQLSRANLARHALPIFLCTFLLGGCGSTTETQVLPWLRYRHMTSSGGTGIWSGSTTSDVALRMGWGWRIILATDAVPARPMPLDESSAVVFTSGGVWMLHPNQSALTLACGDTKADVIVTPMKGFVDCVDFLAGPAFGVRTAVRVRRVSSGGNLIEQWNFAVHEPGRLLLTPTIGFYDAQDVPYLVSFLDPWTAPDGTRGAATPERRANLRCELMRAAGQPESGIPARPGS